MKQKSPNNNAAKRIKQRILENISPSQTETTSRGYTLGGPTSDGFVGLERRVGGVGAVILWLSKEDASQIMAKFGPASASVVGESKDAGEKPAGKSAKAMRQWNANGKTPLYTKAEHSKAPGLNAREITAWNISRGDTEKYSKAEHKKAKGCDKAAMEAWNRLKAGPAYTKAELEGSK